MRFNEFNEPTLTEEQQIVLDYCLGNITKEDAVQQLSEAPAKLTTPDGFATGGGVFGSPAGKSFFGGIKNFFKKNILGPALGGTGGTASQRRELARRRARQSNTANRAAMTPQGQTTSIKAGPPAATAAVAAGGREGGQGAELGAVGGAKPAAPKPAAPQTFGQAFAAARKAAGGAGGVFTFGGKKYNTSIKGEKVGKNLKPVGTATAPAAKPGTPKGMPGAMAGGTKPAQSDNKAAKRAEIQKQLTAKRQELGKLKAQRAGQGYA